MAIFEILQPLFIIRVIENDGDTYLLRPMTKVNGVWIDTDLSTRSQEVQDFAASMWTAEIKAAYIVAMDSQPLYPSPDPTVDPTVPPPDDPFSGEEPPDKSVRYFETADSTFPVEPQVGDLWFRQDLGSFKRRVTDIYTTETWVTALSAHQHEITEITGLTAILDSKADAAYYYTKLETDILLGTKADLSLFDNYYTKPQVDTLLNNIEMPTKLNEVGTYVMGRSRQRRINPGELVHGSTIAICGIASRRWIYVLTGTWRVMGGLSPRDRRSLFLKVD